MHEATTEGTMLHWSPQRAFTFRPDLRMQCADLHCSLHTGLSSTELTCHAPACRPFLLPCLISVLLACVATINIILQLSETHSRLLRSQHRAVNTANDVEASAHGLCSSSGKPRCMEANKAHSVASASTETGEQPTISHSHQQGGELLKLPSNQRSADACKLHVSSCCSGGKSNNRSTRSQCCLAGTW